MPNLKWPDNFNPKLFKGKTILLPLCIDSVKHETSQLRDLVELLNFTYTELKKEDPSFFFKIQFVRVDTLYRHNSKFLKECDWIDNLQTSEKPNAPAAAQGKMPPNIKNGSHSSSKDKEEQMFKISEQEINEYTQRVTTDWIEKNQHILQFLLHELKAENFIQSWEHWKTGANEITYKSAFNDISALEKKGQTYDDLYTLTHLKRDISGRYDQNKGYINSVHNSNSPRFGEIQKILRITCHDYCVEENAVVLTWALLGFEYLIYPSELSNGMSYIMRTHCKNLKHVLPQPNPLALINESTTTRLTHLNLPAPVVVPIAAAITNQYSNNSISLPPSSNEKIERAPSGPISPPPIQFYAASFDSTVQRLTKIKEAELNRSLTAKETLDLCNEVYQTFSRVEHKPKAQIQSSPQPTPINYSVSAPAALQTTHSAVPLVGAAKEIPSSQSFTSAPHVIAPRAALFSTVAVPISVPAAAIPERRTTAPMDMDLKNEDTDMPPLESHAQQKESSPPAFT